MRAHMGGLPETHVMYHSTHITDIITDRDDVRHPCYSPQHPQPLVPRVTAPKQGESALLRRSTWPVSSKGRRARASKRRRARTSQWLQKIPLCGRLASLEATHREDQGFGQGKDCFRLCRFKKDTIDLTIEENPVTRFSSMDAVCRFREPYTSATSMGPV